jgi:hypothetical protein
LAMTPGNFLVIWRASKTGIRDSVTNVSWAQQATCSCLFIP